jgi:hypothetical protein
MQRDDVLKNAGHSYSASIAHAIQSETEDVEHATRMNLLFICNTTFNFSSTTYLKHDLSNPSTELTTDSVLCSHLVLFCSA